MGITLNDIAAQRAMLARGEEKRKADWKQAERERLRDTFAAAALTGLLRSVPVDNVYYDDAVAKQAYASADAMLRERDNHSEKPNSSPTLTNEEREAIEVAAVAYAADHGERFAAILRRLLERLHK